MLDRNAAITDMLQNNTTVDPYKPLPFSTNSDTAPGSTAPFTPAFVTENLTLSADPSGLYAERVRGKHLLLENPARKSRAKRAQEEKHKRAKAKAQAVARSRAGSVHFLKETQFRLFIPLHHLWLGYMSELFGLAPPPCDPSVQLSPPSGASMHPKLVKADFHGAFITVRRAKNPSLVGISGIIIYETENAFNIITRQDKLKLIPKQNSVFSFAVPLYSTISPSPSPGPSSTSGIVPLSSDIPAPVIAPDERLGTVLDGPHIEFELYGNQFRFRSTDRVGRKFKHKETIEL